ncbi:MAG: SpoIIE family protein phosphatase [Leptospiraceae bacterium]|nr:SpoIIE family protein phosphatase [Leptospiraceae bacterium]
MQPTTQSPDVSGWRLCLLLQALTAEYGEQAVLEWQHDLTPAQHDLLHGLTEQTWIPGEQESSLLYSLCHRFDSWRHLARIGKSCFHRLVEQNQIMPLQIQYEWEHILQFPLFLQMITNRLYARPSLESVDPDTAQGSVLLDLIYMDRLDPHSLIDVLFYEGLLRSFCQRTFWEEVEISVTKTTMLQSDWPKRAAIHNNIQWAQGYHQFCLRSRAFLQPAVPAKPAPSSTIHSPNQFDKVLEKSVGLLKDKRELTTSVEYLHMANAQLEKQIAASRRELIMARNIQKGFVPRRIPDWSGLQFWIKFYPMTEVSGDFYDYFSIGSNRLGLLVCDVSGHGVPAALITAIAKLSFNNHRLDSPAEVFNRVNLDLLRYVKQEGYLTGFYMLIDKDYNIIYSRAAGPAAFLCRAATNEVERLGGEGTLLGMFPDASRHFRDQSTHLEPGDKVLIFTDGVLEARNVHDEMYGEERLIEALQQTAGMDIQHTSEQVMRDFERFTLGTDQGDDITMIAMMLSEQQAEFNEYISIARRAFHAREYQEACRFMLAAVEIFPRHTTALYILARYLIKADRFREAQEFLIRYNGLRPYNADAWSLLARSLLAEQNLAQAEDALKRSLSLRSENPRALYLLARLYLLQDKKDKAAQCALEIKQIKPDSKYLEQLRAFLTD